ncbi:MAG: hypothetical protein L0G94_04680 [Brachybacterium sp.]|uniref:hypothetical protein n=1 Tax=Brachybacterium sp. TaxID=1891286 RepID=UPI002647EBD4|nr:hypothetical protein [Brachybacterium sp.]MDN5685967.1 hypothetical protein [Brachybacterium sp.]
MTDPSVATPGSAPTSAETDSTATDSTATDGAVPARTGHRLQLPRDTDPQDVLAMVRNVRPQARLGPDGVIDCGDDTRLVPDHSPRGAGRWTLDTPCEREDPMPEGMTDSHGYGRAFPEGVPFGAERRALDLVWSLGRRLYGAVVTDDGHRLEPHPFHVRDLTVVSPHALAPESFAQLLAPLEPEAELDQVPEGVSRPGYSATIDLDDGGHIEVRVARSSRPVALAELSWRDDAVDYELVHVPADEVEDAIESPDAETAERWSQIYRRIGLIAGLLTETVGGYIVDPEGFLVDPDHLA